ncbi:MAG: peptidylprolyl isomerase [Deltaproteobacteria bacterium]|nr:peptidylprolyl isomerase [Deltaproteobacteria bacterium]
MKKVERGHFVKLDYTGTLENGEVFDSSRNSHPIEVEVGAGRIIKGFEDALIGMVENEKKTFTLSPEEAQVGQVLALRNPQGGRIPAKVTHVDEEKITVDLNHPLAGKTLTFEVKVLEINDTPSLSSCTPSACSSCGSTCS